MASVKIFEHDSIVKIKQKGLPVLRSSQSLASRLENLKWLYERGIYKDEIQWNIGSDLPMKVVTAAEQYAQDIEREKMQKDGRSKRGVISSWTYPARRRTGMALRNGMEKMRFEFVLTLPGENPCMDGKVIKQCLDVLEGYLRKKNIDWFWIQEWQDRGAWHGHVCVSDWISEAWLRQKWADIVLVKHPGISKGGAQDFRTFCLGGYRDENGKPLPQVRVIRKTKHYGFYLRKYMGKDENKVVPEGFKNPGRFSGWSEGFLMFIEKFFNPDSESGKLFLRCARRHRKAEMRSWGPGRYKKRKHSMRFRPGSVGFVDWNGSGFVKRFCELFPELGQMAI